MRRQSLKRCFAFTLAAALAVCLLLTAAAALEPEEITEEFDGYLVILHPSVAPMGLGRTAPAITLVPVVETEGIYRADTMEETNIYVHAGMVEGIYPNYRVELTAFPNDPEYTAGRQTNLDLIGMPEVWQQYPTLTGAGVRIAVIDSGIHAAHPDLQRPGGGSCVEAGKNYTPDGVSSLTDIDGHATRVAGIIAAATGNGLGVAGVAPDATIVSLKSFYWDGTKTTAGMEHVLPAIYDAVNEFDCQVINMSFRFKVTDDLPYRPMTDALAYAASKGALLVAAAGNDGGVRTVGTTGAEEQYRPAFPAADAIVAGVGSVNADGTVASHSQRNAYTCVSAPGVSITSTSYSTSAGTTGYASGNGTSYAAPQVAAAAALLKQLNPNLTQLEFKALLTRSASPLTAGGTYNAYGGAGILNLPALIKNAAAPQGGRTAEIYAQYADEGSVVVQCFLDGAGYLYFGHVDATAAGSAQLIAAGYDEHRRMVEVRMTRVTLTPGGARLAVPALTSPTVREVRLFLLTDTP